jgi:hypothetical protein
VSETALTREQFNDLLWDISNHYWEPERAIDRVMEFYDALPVADRAGDVIAAARLLVQTSIRDTVMLDDGTWTSWTAYDEAMTALRDALAAYDARAATGTEGGES